ncbi:hypothetical protein FRB93_006617 [Tulasnella sp. JGI-2019a]|nr:hypothetical protein FRB93_006617 [Tulasnella sp. JGI-2019a]
MSITHIKSLSQLDGILSAAGSKLTVCVITCLRGHSLMLHPGKLSSSSPSYKVIDFHATWCGPCHAIAPKYESLAKEYTGVQFLKCDVDECQDVARQYSITAMPSFVFIKSSSKVDVVRGADPRSLEATIKKHAGTATGGATGAFSGKGQTLGGSEPSPAAGSKLPATIEGVTNIDPQIKMLGAFLAIYVLYWYLK